MKPIVEPQNDKVLEQPNKAARDEIAEISDARCPLLSVKAQD